MTDSKVVNQRTDAKATTRPKAALMKSVVAGAALAVMALGMTTGTSEAQNRLQAGSLVCKGKGGWGAIITSKKTFDCTFATRSGRVRGSYTGTIRKFGIDIGITGDTALVWLVFGPATKVGENYEAGSLAGEYAGIGAEASVGVGIGANALIGGGDDSFALQPISVQVQSGLSIAAGVQTLTLEYNGPIN